MNVDFDSMGTLFELTPVRERLGDAATDTWFERILHSAATLTMFGEFVPFADLARTTLGTTVAKLALDSTRTTCSPSVNSCRPRPRRASTLERAGLDGYVERVFGVDEVRAYKPDARAYRLVLDELGEATLSPRTHGMPSARPAQACVRSGSTGRSASGRSRKRSRHTRPCRTYCTRWARNSACASFASRAIVSGNALNPCAPQS